MNYAYLILIGIRLPKRYGRGHYFNRRIETMTISFCDKARGRLKKSLPLFFMLERNR